MPFVNVKIIKEPETTPEMKRRVIQGITEVLVDVLGKEPATTFVVIDEVHTDDWGYRGTSVSEARTGRNK